MTIEQFRNRERLHRLTEDEIRRQNGERWVTMPAYQRPNNRGDPDWRADVADLPDEQQQKLLSDQLFDVFGKENPKALAGGPER